MIFRSSFLVSLVALVGCLFEFSAADEWPQFRGPDGQGVVTDAKVPVRWSETEHVAWSAEIDGKGWSSPVVLGDQIWLTTAVKSEPTSEQIQRQFAESGLDEEKFKRRQVSGTVSYRVLCLRRENGQVLHDIEAARDESPAAIHIGNSYASPTPVVEPGRIYCHFDAATVCIDTATGKTIWKREIPVFYSVGAGSSPVLYDDLLILVCDGVDQQFVIALDKHTGQPVWKTKRPPFRTADGQHRKAYSTPLTVQHDGQDQLVIPGAQWVVAYEPRTGKEIWRVDHGVGFSNVPRPIFGNGMVYICTGFGSKALWAIRVDGTGDVTDTHVAWKQNSQIPTNPSPVLVGDLIFLVSDIGIASCVDAVTGDQYWKARIGGSHSASPIAIDNRIYFFSHEGQVTTIEAAKSFHEIAQGQFPGSIMASPAVLDSSVLLRTDSHLYCLR